MTNAQPRPDLHHPNIDNMLIDQLAYLVDEYGEAGVRNSFKTVWPERDNNKILPDEMRMYRSAYLRLNNVVNSLIEELLDWQETQDIAAYFAELVEQIEISTIRG